jgi:hypothetical protein
MYSDRDIATLISEACHNRWPGRHIAGLAEKFRCSKAAVAFWHSGRRQMPPAKMAELAASLRESAEVLNGFARGLDEAANQVRGRRARGFQKVQDWDGTGIECDRRWRGGRGRKREAL